MLSRSTQRLISHSSALRLVNLSLTNRKVATTSARHDANYMENINNTTVNILNREMKNIITIKSYSNFGFRLNSDVFALGPIAILPTAMFSWTVATHHDIDIPSLTLFWLLEPKVDILVIGTGEKREFIDPDVRSFLSSRNISTEIQDTRQACATYNYLASEMRNVGLAVIPPASITLTDPSEFFDNINIKKKFGSTDTKAADEADAFYETYDRRQYDRWWRGDYTAKDGRTLPHGYDHNYQENLKKWKELKVDEDDRVSFDKFEAKTERELIEEKKKKKSQDPVEKLEDK